MVRILAWSGSKTWILVQLKTRVSESDYLIGEQSNHHYDHHRTIISHCCVANLLDIKRGETKTIAVTTHPWVWYSAPIYKQEVSLFRYFLSREWQHHLQKRQDSFNCDYGSINMKSCECKPCQLENYTILQFRSQSKQVSNVYWSWRK